MDIIFYVIGVFLWYCVLYYIYRLLLNELRKFYIFVLMKLNVFNWEVIELFKEVIDGCLCLNNLNKERKI